MLEGRAEVLVIEVPQAMSRDFAEKVRARLSALDETVRVVAFAGASPEVFSLGMDLERLVREEGDACEAIEAIGAALLAVHQCPRPTLGIARGRAAGGGVGLLAACDLVLADETASFGFPELLWGFVPAAIWPLITARMGAARARAWAMTGHARLAGEARTAGLVDELVAAGELERAAARAVRQLARVDRGAIGALRRWSAEAAALPVEEGIRRGAALSAEMLAEPRVLARLRAFFVDGDLPWGGAG